MEWNSVPLTMYVWQMIDKKNCDKRAKNLQENVQNNISMTTVNLNLIIKNWFNFLL